MAEKRLVGQNYTTPDLLAKVTGAAKYAEDYRAEGMLFVKLYLSPMPHARVTRLDTSAALALPGVKAVLTVDDLPPPADSVLDSGAVIRANTRGERALTNEPMYYGEPIFAVAAVDELTAAEAIERVEIEFEPLPFAVDPLATLRPDGPNPRGEGNIWDPPKPGTPPGIQEIKWTEADFADAKAGKLPMGKHRDTWTYGDVEAGFKNAALVLDRTFVAQNTSNQPLETRTVMAYWQNGRVHIHTSTQSTAQTVPAVGRWLGIPPSNVVVVSEYTGGGFGSKITGAVTLIIPALLSKKANAPCMMRITREEEHYIGGARDGVQARIKVGFAKDGKITAVDLYTITDAGPYEDRQGGPTAARIISLMYQPPAMKWRGVTMITNTPPRRPQRQPGGAQGIAIMEPVMLKAAKQLGLDQVEIHRANIPAGKANFGPAGTSGKRPYVTSAFVKEAIDKGVEIFKWDEKKALSGKRSGTKVRGIGIATSAYTGGSIGFDGLCIIRPDGRLQIQSGIGNHGSESVSDCHRVTAEVLGVPWEKVDIVWGSTAKNLPWSCISGGSSTAHAMTRAAHAAGMDAKKKLQEIAAKDLGGAPTDYEVAAERVTHKGGGRSMTLAQAATRAIALGGAYDGHEIPTQVNAMTKASAAALAGQGLMGVARDTYPHDGQTYSYCVGLAEVDVDVETGKYQVLEYVVVGDVGTILHPRSLGGQIMGGSLQGIGHAQSQRWVYDQHYGVALATRFYQNRPMTILDAPLKMQWAAVDLPDPETPVGVRGVGEPPVGAGYAAVLNALADAVGPDIFERAPVTPDFILMGLDAGGKRMHEPLTADI